MATHPNPNVLSETTIDPRGTVARITIDYPSRLNVFSSPLMEALTKAIHAASEKPDLRALVLTGAGDRAFIAGADIKEFAQLEPGEARAFITRVHKVCQALRECPVPAIARINGYCLGAGLEVAAACDLRAASRDATFGMPEVRVGVPSVVEAALLPRLIGWGKTNELLLTGDTVTANEALQMGLVECVTDPGQLDTKIDAWLDSILSAGPRAIRLQKALLRQWESLPLDDAIQAGIDTFSVAFRTGEPHQYAKPFLNRKARE